MYGKLEEKETMRRGVGGREGVMVALLVTFFVQFPVHPYYIYSLSY